MIETHFFTYPNHNMIRRIQVILPANYYKNTKKYPVIFFHDGQNMLFDYEGFCGQSWQLLKHLKALHVENKYIIVLIDHANNNRIVEMNPDQQGADYAKFIVETVLVTLSKTYRIKTKSKYHTIAGSSMGALISLAISQWYPDYFDYYILFSLPGIFTLPKISYHKNHRFLLMSGGKETQSAIDQMLACQKILLQKGHSIKQIEMKLDLAGAHNEQTWSSFLADLFTFIQD